MVIYPNPAQATVTLEWQEHGPPAKHQARIYDVTGQLVLDQTLRTPRSVLSFQSFPPGTYFLQHVVDGKVVEVRPVIVQP
ncbi:MAG: T9SS type A sorting domain-containing protein [Saprospiraceae bacterium]